jgi:hypothetical protein
MYKALNLTTEPQFKQTDHETLELTFGLATIQMKQNGKIIFKNSKANLTLNTDGNIYIDGLNIYLNSATKGLNNASNN